MASALAAGKAIGSAGSPTRPVGPASRGIGMSEASNAVAGAGASAPAANSMPSSLTAFVAGDGRATKTSLPRTPCGNAEAYPVSFKTPGRPPLVVAKVAAMGGGRRAQRPKQRPIAPWLAAAWIFEGGQ